MGLLDGKQLLITGVLKDNSIAFHVARLAQDEGATVVLSSFGRMMKITQAIARRLPQPAPVVELDVTDPEHLAALAGSVGEHVDRLDGVLHSIGFAPQAALGGNFLHTGWEDVATAVPRVGLLAEGARHGGPAPAASGVQRGRADLRRHRSPGRSTTGWASPRRPSSPPRATSPGTSAPRASGSTWWLRDRCAPTAATSIPGLEAVESTWAQRAPLGWDVSDPEPTARACCALMSDWFPATTAEIVHVDGGVHAMGV
jgi:enoyl-[acyl-carrier protein] reductase I